MWPPPRGDPQLSPTKQACEGFFVAAVPLGEEEEGSLSPQLGGTEFPVSGEPKGQGGDKSLSEAAPSGSGLV